MGRVAEGQSGRVTNLRVRQIEREALTRLREYSGIRGGIQVAAMR